MRILFLGTPDIAVPSLERLASCHEIACVITQPDKPVGRSGKLSPSPVGAAAERLELPVIKPAKLDSETIAYLTALHAELFVTFAYGKIFREPFFRICPLGGVNIHPSLLPDLRGPSPIQSALLNGYTRSGITVQKIALEVDSGDIINQKIFTIEENDDENSLESRISVMAAEQICEVMQVIEKEGIAAVPQDHAKATYCRTIAKEDGMIDWNKENKLISDQIRAFAKWPVASTLLDGKRLNLYKVTLTELKNGEHVTPGTIITATKGEGIVVACGSGALKIEELQLQGKNRLYYKDFINGYRDLQGKRLGMQGS